MDKKIKENDAIVKSDGYYPNKRYRKRMDMEAKFEKLKKSSGYG